MFFNVNFNVFLKLIKVHLLMSELYIYKNAQCNDKNCVTVILLNHIVYTLDRAFYCKLLNEFYIILYPNTANKVLCC